MKRLCWALGAVCSLASCGSSIEQNGGQNEPIRVANAQFFPGSLTGTDAGPRCAALLKSSDYAQGATARNALGTADGTAFSVAMRLRDAGSGYWAVPVGSLSNDPAEAGKLTWSANFDISRGCPTGPQTLEFAAIDGEGRLGAAETKAINILSNIPSGDTVISLVWDNHADLDLHLVVPSGKELDPKHPNTAVITPEAAAILGDGGTLAGNGVLDRDANAACQFDGYLREDVVFQDPPPAGIYQVRVDMFSACGEAAATFQVQLWRDGSLVSHQAGRLLSIDADGGGPGSGLFIQEFVF